MEKPTINMKKKLLLFIFCAILGLALLIARLFYIQIFFAEEWSEIAYDQQTRDRLISAKRGNIFDRNNIGIALTETVNTISVIPVQVKDKETTANYLAEKLQLDYNYVLEKVQQNVALVRIKSNVDMELASEIRSDEVAGVMVDEDTKRIYPYSEMASQVIGFVGSDNQGILGLDLYVIIIKTYKDFEL